MLYMSRGKRVIAIYVYSCMHVMGENYYTAFCQFGWSNDNYDINYPYTYMYKEERRFCEVTLLLQCLPQVIIMNVFSPLNTYTEEY